MNAPPSLGFWLQLFMVLAVGAAVIVGLAELLGRWTSSAILKRTLWQTALLGLAVLALCELTGLADMTRGVARAPREEGPGAWSKEAAGRTGAAAEESQGATEEGNFPSSIAHFALGDREQNDEPVNDSSATLIDANDASSSMPVASLPSSLATELPLAWWPGLFWLMGMVVVAGRVLVANLLLLLFRRRHPETTNAVLAARVEAIAARLGLRRRVRVLDGGRLSGPVAFGIWRPTLALPASFTRAFDAAQQDVMLAHEIAHLAGRDPSWHLLADLLTALFWWHPLVWWCRHQLRAACEAAADEGSLVVADGPGVLADCLVALGTQLAERGQPGWLRMAGSGFRSSLGRRVERLLHLKDSASVAGIACRRGARTWLTLSLGPVTLLAAALASTAWARTSETDEGDPNMKQSWKRSLAGLMFLSTLAANDTPSAGQDPETREVRAKSEVKALAAGETPPLRLHPLGTGSASTEASDVATVNSGKFRLPFKIDPAQTPNVRELRLYDSTDHGKTWKQLAVANTNQQAFEISVAEGLHWFGLVLVHTDGRLDPPDVSQLPASLKVAVRSGQSAAADPDDTPQQRIGKIDKDIKSLKAMEDELQRFIENVQSKLKEDPTVIRKELDAYTSQLDRVKKKMDDLVAQRKKTEAELNPETPGTDPGERELQERIRKLSQELTVLDAKYNQVRSVAAPGTNEDRLAELRKQLADIMAQHRKAEAELKALQAKRTRVFRLTHSDPHELHSILSMLLRRGEGEEAAAGGAALSMGSAMGSGPGGMRPGGNRGYGGGRLANTTWRIAADARTNTLIVRGNADDVQTAADIVALLDTPPDKPRPKVKNLKLFRLRFASAPEIASVLHGLGIDARIVPVAKDNSLLVAGSEESTKEIGDLIVALDVDVDAKKPKGGGSTGAPNGSQ